MSTRTHDIQRLQAMQEDAWADLQAEYFRRVFYYVKRYVQDHQTAEDLTQDVFLGAVRGIASYDPSFTLDQFVFGIARNRVIDHFRKHKIALVPAKGEAATDASRIWLENMADGAAEAPKNAVVRDENQLRQRQVLATDPSGDVDARIVEVRVALAPEDAWRGRALTGLKVIARLQP